MSTGLNIQGIVSHVSESADSGMQDVADLAKNIDPTSPADMAKMQMAMMRMNMAFQLQAAMIKSIEDMLKAVVQRM